jgi:hypothetical protein
VSTSISVKPLQHNFSLRAKDANLICREVLSLFLNDTQDPNHRQWFAHTGIANEKDDSQIVIASNDVINSQFTNSRPRKRLNPAPIQVDNLSRIVGQIWPKAQFKCVSP